MGKQQSKDKKNEEEDSKEYDKKMIYIDEYGNFVYGDKQFDPDEEAIRVMNTDDPIEEDGKEWYIINTSWMNAWLMYCHLNKNVNPNPGPCRNECLLESNQASTGWVSKSDLVMARKDKEGDYRRISKATWEVFCELYPGSGPAIRVNFYENEEHKYDGLYDTSDWIIDQTNYKAPPAQPVKKLESRIQSQISKDIQTKSNPSVDVSDPMTGSQYGKMDSPNNLSDEQSRASFKQFFGSTVNPIMNSNVAYSPTNRSSESKEKENSISETERALLGD